MKSLTQTRFLATNYSYLQGLKSIPLGLALFLLTAWANTQQGAPRDFTLVIIVILGAVLLSLVIDQYYKRTFGEVKPTSANRVDLIGAVIGGTLTLGAFWATVSFELPFTPIGLAFAAAFLADNPKPIFPLDKFSVVKLVFAILLLALSFAPLYLGLQWWNVLGIQSALIGITLVFSMLMVAQGVIWHLHFVNSLPAVGGRDD